MNPFRNSPVNLETVDLGGPSLRMPARREKLVTAAASNRPGHGHLGHSSACSFSRLQRHTFRLWTLALTLASGPCLGGQPAPFTLLESALAGPLRDTRSLLFVVRDLHADWWHPTPDLPGDGTPLSAPAPNPVPLEDAAAGGAAVCRLDLRTGEREVLLRLSPGDIRGCQLDHEGRRLVLSVRQGEPGEPFHLAEFALDGSRPGAGGEGLRILTDGPFDDIDPEVLPNGSIVFASSRARRWSGWGDSRVFTLHQCAGDGSAIRPYSSHVEMQREPRMLPDGRVLFAQQESIHRRAPRTSQLFAGNQDGTQYHAVFGTGAMQALSLLQARPLPQSGRFIAVAVPWAALTREVGWLAIVDPSLGPDQPDGIRLLGLEADRMQRVLDGVADYSPGDPPLRVEHTELGWRYPYPLTEELFLALTDREIWLVDGEGTAELLFTETRFEGELASVQPLAARPKEARMPTGSPPLTSEGQIVVADVHSGPPDLPRGSVRKILVIEELPRPVPNPDGVPEPISRGGPDRLRRVLGTVPVEEDGSASFRVPSMTTLCFVLLDAEDRMVRPMRSWISLMPGERRACVGCHEPRRQSARSFGRPTLQALQRPPSRLRHPPGTPPILDYVRDIQPLLDRHCGACHSGRSGTNQVVLSGEPASLFSRSYVTLMAWAQFENETSPGRDVPGTRGSAASPLVDKLMGNHHDVEALKEEVGLVKTWIDVGAPFAGTYATVQPEHYLAWMKRHGALAGGPLPWPADGHALDQRYFELVGGYYAYAQVRPRIAR